jgi:hypothetical protein
LPAFVMVRDLGGIKLRCKSGPIRSEALRDEAMQICRSAALPAN